MARTSPTLSYLTRTAGKVRATSQSSAVGAVSSTAARAPRDGDLFDSKDNFKWYGWCAEYGKDELIPKDSVLVVKRVNTRQKLKGLCEDTKPLLGNVAYEASIDSPKVSEKIKKLDCTVILPRAQCDTRQ